MKEYDKAIIPLAKNLRKKMTPEERKLWYMFLRDCSYRFCRQKTIGHYIVDFYCAKAHLVIELDGSQHYGEQGQDADKVRDEYLKSQGLQILRYSNADVNHRFREVCEDILRHVSTSSVTVCAVPPSP